MTCPSCGAVAPEGARFCPACGHAFLVRADERRIVTVLFADLVGFTSLSETSDPEHVKNLVDRYFERLVADVRAFGGRVDKILGDAIIALFGAPIAHEDDAERAVRAALQMQRTIAHMAEQDGIGIRMRVGINTGEVLVGALRAGGDYTAMGDVVNTAERLQSQAQGGQVVVGSETFLATREVVSYEPLGHVRVKGREEPVDAHVALDVLGPPGWRPTRRRTPLVGRDDELEMLKRALATTVARKRAHLLLLLGEAGLGKSRLAEEVSDIALARHDAFVLSGRCLPYGEANVWYPVAEALRQACGIDADDSADESREKCRDAVVTATRREPGDEEVDRMVDGLLYFMGFEVALHQLEPARARDLAMVAVQDVLEGIARRHPVVLVLSELHWADPLVFEVIERLLDRLRQLPFAIVATARPEFEERWTPKPGRHNLIVVHLEPLDSDAAATLLDVLLEGATPPELRAVLLERSGGNPFFLEELANLLAEGRFNELPSRLDVPATLRGLVTARIDALSDSERAVLEDAAVVGRTGSLDAVRVVAASRGETDPEHLAGELAARDLLVVEGRRFEFKSDLVREVAYTTLTKAERARRHAALAERLAGKARATERESEYLEALAHHYSAAAELVNEIGRVEGVPPDIRDRALDALERAAAKAEAREIARSSLYLFDQALRLAEPGQPARRRFLLGRARAHAHLREHESARTDANLVLADAEKNGDTADVARALTVLGDVLTKESRFGEATGLLGTAIAAFREVGDDLGEAIALRLRGMAHLFAGQYEAAEADLSAALDRSRSLGDRRGEAWALQNLAWLTVGRGDPATAEARLEASAALFTEIGDITGRSWAVGLLGYVRFGQGRLEEAEQIALEIMRVAEKDEDRWAYAMMLNLLANVRLWRGSTQEACDKASEAIRILREVHDTWAEFRALHPLMLASALSGRPDDARRTMEQARELGDQMSDGSARWGFSASAAQLHNHLSDPEMALAELHYTEHERCNERHDGEWLATAGIALLQLGRVDEAIARLEEAYSGAPSEGLKGNAESAIALAYAAGGRLDEAIAAADQVEGLKGGSYLDRVLARLARGFAHTRHGDMEAADADFASACALVDATEDRLNQALVRLAHGRALEAIGAAEATGVLADSLDRLAAMGVTAGGWDTAFRLAAQADGRARRTDDLMSADERPTSTS